MQEQKKKHSDTTILSKSGTDRKISLSSSSSSSETTKLSKPRRDRKASIWKVLLSQSKSLYIETDVDSGRSLSTVSLREKGALMLTESEVDLGKTSRIEISTISHAPMFKESDISESDEDSSSSEESEHEFWLIEYVKEKLGIRSISDIEVQQLRKDLSLQLTENVPSTQTVPESEDEKSKDALMLWKENARKKRLSRIETVPIVESKVGSEEKTRRQSDISQVVEAKKGAQAFNNKLKADDK